VTAAARAALRFWLTGEEPKVIGVRLPFGGFLPVSIAGSGLEAEGAWASVIKDGGDDPDVTHGAELKARIRCFSYEREELSRSGFAVSCGSHGAERGGICLIAGEGVGVVTKAGLPVRMGEPAVNPAPREMLARNLAEELLRWLPKVFEKESNGAGEGRELSGAPSKSYVFLPFDDSSEYLANVFVEVEVAAPKGAELAKHTLNPRLGIVGGISILGTTGIVRPFSHEAYEETIHAALAVARANGCRDVVLSTGGKSEHFARDLLRGLTPEAFVQIADFFSFGVREVSTMGFSGLVHSAFFGKVVKMAQGHAYTHAHKVSLDLAPLAQLAAERGYDELLCRDLTTANTARQALELLLARGAMDVIDGVARQALEQSRSIAGTGLSVRLLLFDYDGTLLADIKS
jgi:cobalt-precorrin-5B (C1)-methyltransferase